MTDTDPRLEAVELEIEDCLRSADYPAAKWWANFIVKGYDALRAFDQAQCVCEMPEYCPKFGCIKSAHKLQPVFREEVMPHKSDGQSAVPGDNAAAPVMGADPPWLDDAAKVASNCYFGFGPSGHCEGWPNVVRAVLAFANAQPPSEAEVQAAVKAWSDNWGYTTTLQETRIRAALIAAAKARSGA